MSHGIKTFHFAQITIPQNQVFVARKHVYGMVNLKPVTAGHVLVCPTRRIQKYRDLTELEVLEIWTTVREVSSMLKSVYNVGATSIVIQDGIHAGQTINHVHVHVIPRSTTGREIESLKIDIEEERRQRTMEEMETEARLYRPHLESTIALE